MLFLCANFYFFWFFMDNEMWFILTKFYASFLLFCRIYNKFTDDSERRKIFIRYSFTLQTTWWVEQLLFMVIFFLYKFIILTSNKKKINQQEVHQCMTVMSLLLSKKANRNQEWENLCEANKAFRGFNRSVLCTHFSRTHIWQCI